MATRTTFPSAPQLPQKPTSTSYENACRHILGQRFRQLLQKTTTLAAIIIPLSTLSLRGSIFSLISKNLVHIALAFVFGILPTLVARKIRRRAPQSPRPKTLAAEVTSISPIYLAFHAVSGAALASVYAFFLGTHVDGLKFSFFTGSNRHPYSVNERHIILVVGNAILGVVYAALDAMSHRDPSWLRRFGGLTQRRSAATWKSVQRSCTFAVYYWPAFLISYLVLRAPSWAIVNSLFGFILRPFLHFVLRSGSVWQLISWSLFWRMFVLQLSSLVMWDVAGEWFEINASQVIHLSQFKEDPNASLIAGLQSKDPYYKNFAFAELANVVSTRPPRRVALFSDLKANPTAWEQVCRECLLFLGQDYSAVVNRHVVPAPPALAPAVTAPARQGTSKITKEGAYKSAQPTQHGPIDAFVGAANTVATVIPANLSVPAIFLSGSHSGAASTEPTPVSQTPTGAGWKLPQVDLASLLSHVLDILPPDAARWARWGWTLFFVERQDAMLEGLLQGRAADVWAIEALSTLVSHSLHEDPYGRVQRGIPRVLEALVLYLGALEQLIDEVNANPTPDTEDAVKGVVQPVADALRDGIRMIVLEFGHRLAAFTFPPKIARRLQTMVDYL